MVNGKSLLCIVDYHSKFPRVKIVKSISADDLIQMTKMIFAEYRLLKKIVSDAGTSLTSQKFKDFYRKLNIQQTITSLYHQQSSGQVKVCIKFVKCTIKNAFTLIETYF